MTQSNGTNDPVNGSSTRRRSMAASDENTQAGSGTLTGNPSTPAKKPRIKTNRKAPAATSRSGIRPAANKPTEPSFTEIIFKEEPNPAVTPQPPYIWIDFPQQ